MKHDPGKMRCECCVCHYDKNGNLLPQCFVCIHCGQYIAHDKHDEECAGKHVPLYNPDGTLNVREIDLSPIIEGPLIFSDFKEEKP